MASARNTALPILIIAMLLQAQPSPAQDHELGRLFLTPEQRTELERLRHAPPAPPPEPVVEAPPRPPSPPPPPAMVEAELPPPVEQLSKEEELLPPAPPPPVPPITVNGLVVRADGQNTAWVNGQSTLEGDFSYQNIEVGKPGRGSVPIITPEHLPNVRLEPGQTYDPATNTIVDVYRTP